MGETKKINYFYIDESGSINSNDEVFIHGCIKTDTPLIVSEALEKLKEEINDNPLFEEIKDKIIKDGFHATDNHFDVRVKVYELLILLNYRAYLFVIKKDTEFFRKMRENFKEHEIYAFSIRKLLRDRVLKNKGAKNVFVFENIEISKKSQKVILTEFFDSFGNEHDCEFKIVGKEEENLATVDYLNYVLYHIIDNVSKNKRPLDSIRRSFDVLAPKIASVNIAHNNVFLSRTKAKDKKVNLENFLREFGGS